jgi:hypothetical protein
MSVHITGDKKALRRTTNLPTNGTAFTICGFVKVVAAQPGQEPHILFTQAASGASAENIFLAGTGPLEVRASDAWGSNESSTVATLTAGGTAGTNWHFLGLRGTAAGAGGLKVSHKPVGSGSIAHQTTANNAGTGALEAMQLGDLPFGTTYWADVLLAHWMVYDRALSDGEMATQAGQGSPASGTDLISYHDFDDTDINNAVIPNTGSGTFVFFNSEPVMSTDMPVFSGNPVFSGSGELPSVIIAAVGGGLPPPIYNRIFRR